MTDVETEQHPLTLLSRAVATELGEGLAIYRQIMESLVAYLAEEGDREQLRLLQNGALTLAIGLSDLGRTLDELDAEGIEFAGSDDPRMARPLTRALADSMTLLLSVRAPEDCYSLNLLDEDEIDSWLETDDLAAWLEKHPF